MSEANLRIPLPAGNLKGRASGWWGVILLIATEASLFAYLLFTYFYMAAQTGQTWPPEGLPSLFIPGMNTLILIASSGFVWACEHCLKSMRFRLSFALMAGALLLGVCFVAVQLKEWGRKNYDITANLYGSFYYTITGFHMLHVVIGLVILSMLLLWIGLGYFNDRRPTAVTVGGLYWHFVDVVWLFVFTTLYITPYLFNSAR